MKFDKHIEFVANNGCMILVYFVIGGLALSVLLAMLFPSSGEHHTDNGGIYTKTYTGEASYALPPVTLALSSEKNAEGMVRIVGTTNLPDGTIVMVTLQNASSEYTAQDKTAVSSGEFKTGFFGNDGPPLVAGTYQVTINTPVAQVQPDNVQAIIGKQGENLTGSFVKTASIGDSKIVRFSQDIEIR